MGGSKAQVEQARATLNDLIELSGLSRREVEQRLVEQGRGTDLARLLSGRLDLKLRHVLDLCRVLGIHPLEFFRMVFKEPERQSPFIQRLEALITPGRLRREVPAPSARPPAEDLDQLRQRVRELMLEVEELSAATKQGLPK
jgi:hypothetical protein